MERGFKGRGKPLQELDLKEGDRVKFTWTDYLWPNLWEAFGLVQLYEVVNIKGDFFLKMGDIVIWPDPNRAEFEKVELKVEHPTSAG